MEQKHNFKPYIPAQRNLPEFTVTSVLSGMLLAFVFGAANAYLGLRVGMTVSASIPAAVIGMGIYRCVRRRDTILESNMVQTIGSAGESLAAGQSLPFRLCFCGHRKAGAQCRGYRRLHS